MNVRIKTVGIGLACCLPLVLAVAGITTGTAGALIYCLGRNEALVIAGTGLVYLLTDRALAQGDRQTTEVGLSEVDSVLPAAPEAARASFASTRADRGSRPQAFDL